MAKQKDIIGPGSMAASQTVDTSAHDASLAAVAKSLKAIGEVRTNRRRAFVNPLEEKRMVALLADGTPWRDIKKLYIDIDDATLEQWKPTLEKAATNPQGVRRMP